MSFKYQVPAFVTIKVDGVERRDLSDAELAIINRIDQAYNCFQGFRKGTTIVERNAWIDGVRHQIEITIDESRPWLS